jgi:chloramphenicol O-acetyltransferase type A
MKRTLALAHWNRREHFDFFRHYDEPYHGVVVNLDCTRAYATCQRDHSSFFITYLHRILQAVNGTDALRLRIESDTVVEFDLIHSGPTIARKDHTFGFCLIEYAADFGRFSDRAQSAMERVKAASGLCLQETAGRDDLIYLSVLPGIQFTGLTNARRLGASAGVPLITVGRCFAQGKCMMMPIAVFAHHALVDGYHLQLFLERLQALLSDPVRDPGKAMR